MNVEFRYSLIRNSKAVTECVHSCTVTHSDTLQAHHFAFSELLIIFMQFILLVV